MKTKLPLEFQNMHSTQRKGAILPNGHEALADFALAHGAVEAVPLSPEHVIVSEQVRYKCQFGCPSYQRNKMCPPHTPPVTEFREVILCYDHALLVRAAPEMLHALILELERQAFLDGHPLALGLIAGSCSLCEKCSGPNVPCFRPEQARPSMEGMGIDVFRTCAKAGLELQVLTNPDDHYLATGLILF